jgi:uncharacterized damage-inducible protein DinB
MPLSNRITVAAQSFNQNASFLKQAVDGLSDKEWVRRPNEHCNHLLWIVGHVTWARSALLGRLGAPWTMPWIPLYSRGAKCVDSPDCPSPSEAMQAWDESCDRLGAAMEAVSEEKLDEANGRPSSDGKVSGLVNFLALHETYHVGQAVYIRSFLGHGGPMG